ncbi:tryptophan-rich sensory protein [Fulvivirga sp. M361]|uniref:tryptophan-rich sensory protein n=1 Tax=Fulvivirga sp. M361 TaxID=2594266 RepID=UPI001179D926|nr:tryptophan-rich sensory protein [Fulvivirga sp. M361]TRX59488.1 tryptophan-rich sensory protein [Fulvivirga sp. M361]
MSQGKKILHNIKTRWRFYRWVETSIYAVCLALIAYSFAGTVAAFITFIMGLSMIMLLLRPWDLNMATVVQLVNLQLKAIHYSAECLLANPVSLTRLGKIQQRKTAYLLAEKRRQVKVPIPVKRIALIFCLFSMVFLGTRYVPLTNQMTSPHITAGDLVLPADTLAENYNWPVVESLIVDITPPKYTLLSSFTQNGPGINVVEGAYAKWEVRLSHAIDGIDLITSANKVYPMKAEGNVYTCGARLFQNGFYSFRFTNGIREYVSDLYEIKVIPDNPPELVLRGVPIHTYFDYNQPKVINITCDVQDDHGITDVYLIGTVTQGSGESVKFREEKLFFDAGWEKGSKRLTLSRRIDLDQLAMGPGDELYFYAETLDNRYPKTQKNRTETFFVGVKDTTKVEFSLAGSLGVDVMPDYFRSQRQLIIDTEKLIKEKKTIPAQSFKSKSNELGHDQKALRIRYGKFMGEEFATTSPGQERGAPEPDPKTGPKDPLKAFMHDHDGDNEHHLVEDHDHDDHSEDKQNKEGNDPLHAYQHIHDDTEEATFFTMSVRQKLKQALTEMWDSELYLRLYQPEKSLPYQYKALRLLKEIKNHSRIYVHRIGFEPPPIKEESRLKGDFDEVISRTKTVYHVSTEPYTSLRNSIPLLQRLLTTNATLDIEQKALLEKAGDELAGLIIQQPGQHLETLQSLRKVLTSDSDPVSRAALIEKALNGVVQAVPSLLPKPSVENTGEHILTQLFRLNLDSIRRRKP